MSRLGEKEVSSTLISSLLGWSLWLESGWYTFSGFCPRRHFCRVLVDSPHLPYTHRALTHTHIHTHHTHTPHVHTTHTLTLHTTPTQPPPHPTESSFLSTGKTSPLRLWTSDGPSLSWEHIIPPECLLGSLHQVPIWSLENTHTFALYNKTNTAPVTATPLWSLLMMIRHMFLWAPDASGLTWTFWVGPSECSPLT